MDFAYFDLGYRGEEQGRWALWQPVLGKFLIVINDLALAQEIKLLSSSRYSLYVCDITTAENYQRNIIDNMCCTNWTMTSRDPVLIHRPYFVDTVIRVEQLVESDHHCDWPLLPEQQWLHLMRFWLEVINIAKDNYGWYHAQNYINELTQENFDCVFDQLNDAMRRIRQILYLERDLTVSERRLLDIRDQNVLIERAYLQNVKHYISQS